MDAGETDPATVIARLRAENEQLRSQMMKPNTSDPIEPASYLEESDDDDNAENGATLQEIDEAFEKLLTDTLEDHSKREALRTSYYQKKNANDRYFFLLEWASYLRKPDALQEESTNNGDGLRQRKTGASRESKNGISQTPYFVNDDNNGKYRRSLLEEDEGCCGLGRNPVKIVIMLFANVTLVLVIYWILNQFFRNRGSIADVSDHDGFDYEDF